MKLLKRIKGAGSTILVFAAVIGLCGMTTSCNPAVATGVGAGIGGVIGHQVDDKYGRYIGAGIGAAIGYAVYKANARQKSLAASRGYSATQKTYVKSNLQKSNTTKVVVPVPSSKRQGKNDMMVYDTEKKALVSDKVYPPKEKSYSEGDTVNIGGYKAVVASSFQGI